jgi:putative endonuclease
VRSEGAHRRSEGGRAGHPASWWRTLLRWWHVWWTSGPLDNQTKGFCGEDLAAGYLRMRGYRILERNWRCRLGEIDIIAAQGETVVIVEVKSGQSRGVYAPRVHLSATKRHRLRRLTEIYMKRAHLRGWGVRVDLIEVILPLRGGAPHIEHFEALL